MQVQSWKTITAENPTLPVGQTLERFFEEHPVDVLKEHLSDQCPKLPKKMYKWLMRNVERINRDDVKQFSKIHELIASNQVQGAENLKGFVDRVEINLQTQGHIFKVISCIAGAFPEDYLKYSQYWKFTEIELGDLFTRLHGANPLLILQYIQKIRFHSPKSALQLLEKVHFTAESASKQEVVAQLNDDWFQDFYLKTKSLSSTVKAHMYHATQKQKVAFLKAVKIERAYGSDDKKSPYFNTLAQAIDRWDGGEAKPPVRELDHFIAFQSLLTLKNSDEIHQVVEGFPHVLEEIMRNLFEYLDSAQGEVFHNYLNAYRRKIKEIALRERLVYTALPLAELMQRVAYETKDKRVLEGFLHQASLLESSYDMPVRGNFAAQRTVVLSKYISNHIPRYLKYATWIQVIVYVASRPNNLKSILNKFPQENERVVEAYKLAEKIKQFRKAFYRGDDYHTREEFKKLKRSGLDFCKILAFLPHYDPKLTLYLLQNCKNFVVSLLPAMDTLSHEQRADILPFLSLKWQQATVEECRKRSKGFLGIDELSKHKVWLPFGLVAGGAAHVKDLGIELEKNDVYSPILFYLAPLQDQLCAPKYIWDQHLSTLYKKIVKAVVYQDYAEIAAEKSIRKLRDLTSILEDWEKSLEAKLKKGEETKDTIKGELSHIGKFKRDILRIITIRECMEKLNNTVEKAQLFEEKILPSSHFVQYMGFITKYFPRFAAYLYNCSRVKIMGRLREISQNCLDFLPFLSSNDLIRNTVRKVGARDKKHWLNTPYPDRSRYQGPIVDYVVQEVSNSSPKTMGEKLEAVPLQILALMASEDKYKVTIFKLLSSLGEMYQHTLVPCLSEEAFAEYCLNAPLLSVLGPCVQKGTREQKVAFLRAAKKRRAIYLEVDENRQLTIYREFEETFSTFKNIKEALLEWDESAEKAPVDLLDEFLHSAWLFRSLTTRLPKDVLFQRLQELTEKYPDILNVLVSNFITLFKHDIYLSFYLISFISKEHKKLEELGERLGFSYLAMPVPEMIQKVVFEAGVDVSTLTPAPSKIYEELDVPTEVTREFEVSYLTTTPTTGVKLAPSSIIHATRVQVVHLMNQCNELSFDKTTEERYPSQVERYKEAYQFKRKADSLNAAVRRCDNEEIMIELEPFKEEPGRLFSFLAFLPHYDPDVSFYLGTHLRYFTLSLLPPLKSLSTEERAELIPFLPTEWQQKTVEEIRKNGVRSVNWSQFAKMRKSLPLSLLAKHVVEDLDDSDVQRMNKVDLDLLFFSLSLSQQILRYRSLDKGKAQWVRSNMCKYAANGFGDQFVQLPIQNLKLLVGEVKAIPTREFGKEEKRAVKDLISYLDEMIFAHELDSIPRYRKEEKLEKTRRRIQCLEGFERFMRLIINYFPKIGSFILEEFYDDVANKIKEIYPDMRKLPAASRLSLLPILPRELVSETVREVPEEEKKRFLNTTFPHKDDFRGSTIRFFVEIAKSDIKDKPLPLPGLKFAHLQGMLEGIPIRTLAYMASEEEYAETTLLWLPVMNDLHVAAVIPCIHPKVFGAYLNAEGRLYRDFFLGFATNDQKEAFTQAFEIEIKIPTQLDTIKGMQLKGQMMQLMKLQKLLLNDNPSEILKKAVEEKLESIIAKLKVYVGESLLVKQKEIEVEESVCALTKEPPKQPCRDGITEMLFDYDAFVMAWKDRNERHPVFDMPYDINKLEKI